MVSINGQRYTKRHATSEGQDCLIDTLRQSLINQGGMLEVQLQDVPTVRFYLESAGFYGNPQGAPREALIKPLDFLTLEFHTEDRLTLLGAHLERFIIVCLDWAHQGCGDVWGNGTVVLHIARVRQNHFALLHPVP